MRNNDPIIYETGTAYDLDNQRQQNYSDSINILQTQWNQADIDQRFYLSDQQLWSSLYPGNNNKKFYNFNIINPIIQSISGFQRQTRKSTVVVPVQNGMQQTADQLTKCLYYVHNNSDAYQVYSNAFEQGALVQGIGLVSIFNDFSQDPVSGDIRLRYIDFKSILIDPFFRREDLSDCRYIWTRQFFGKDEAANLFPMIADQIMNASTGNFRDDKFYYMPEIYQLQQQNLVAIDEYWYLATREATYIVDTETNEMQEFTGDEEDLRVVNMYFNGRLKVVKKPKQTVRRQILINDKVALDEPNPYGIDRYPYVASLGYFCPDTSYYGLKFRGVVRDLRDSQYLFNRLKISDLDILEAQQQGLIITEGTLVTPDDALNSGHGRVLFRKKGSSPEDIQPMDIRPPSPVMLQMEELLQNMVYRIAGVDPAAMGIDVDDKAGIITMMRQAATARNLQRLFDQMDFMQRQAGDIITEMIQKNWTFTKIKNVLGEEPTPEFDNKLFFKYGCKVIQAALTETQQQLELSQILELQKMYPHLNLSDEVIDTMMIQNKDKLKEKLNAQSQAKQEQEQKMAELQMQQMQVDNETKLSYAESQRGLAAERIARIETDMAVAQDKIKRAHTQDTESLVNVLKAIKELEGLDLNQLEQKIRMLQSLQPDVMQTPTVVEEKEVLV